MDYEREDRIALRRALADMAADRTAICPKCQRKMPPRERQGHMCPPPATMIREVNK